MNKTINHDALAIDVHCRTTDVRSIIDTHGITIEQLADWVESKNGKTRLAALQTIDRVRRGLHLDQLEAIALRGLVNVAMSPKATDASRKACHDLRAIAADDARTAPTPAPSKDQLAAAAMRLPLPTDNPSGTPHPRKPAGAAPSPTQLAAAAGAGA